MATVYWEPKVEAVAQVASASIDTVDGTPADNTFTVTIGGVAISQVGTTDVATTAAALVALLNASTHPYFAAITWANPSAGNITATADTAGVPFTAALTETGAGSGTVTDFTDDTANASPHDAGAGDNWSSGAIPATNDDVIIADSSVSLLYGLDGLTNAIDELRVDHSFTGKIGLERSGFATDLAADSRDSTVPEYRSTYLEVEADRIVIGRATGLEATGGSERIKIDNSSNVGASLLLVEQTVSSVTTGRPAVRYLANSSGADVEVLEAPGGVGIAADEPGETATVGDVVIVDSTTTARVITGEGCTLTSWSQQGGSNRVSAAASISSVEVYGGELEIVGTDYTITSLTVDGGTVTDRHTQSSGNEWTTINATSGTLDLTDTEVGRTATTMNLSPGVTVNAEWSQLTLTTLTKPTGLASLSVAEI